MQAACSHAAPPCTRRGPPASTIAACSEAAAALAPFCVLFAVLLRWRCLERGSVAVLLSVAVARTCATRRWRRLPPPPLLALAPRLPAAVRHSGSIFACFCHGGLDSNTEPAIVVGKDWLARMRLQRGRPAE